VLFLYNKYKRKKTIFTCSLDPGCVAILSPSSSWLGLLISLNPLADMGDDSRNSSIHAVVLGDISEEEKIHYF